MDYEKTGALIRQLRQEKGCTQLQLAAQLHISDKTVSKWERGLGYPDVALLPALSEALGVRMETLLRGERERNVPDVGNMRKTRFYVCASCGNLLTSAGDCDVTCCGAPLAAQHAEKADEVEKLSVECMEDEYFVSTNHEMTKDHYVAFVALLKGDTLVLRRMYPEWNLETRLPAMRRAMLLWYCTKHGLKYQWT